MNTTAPQAPIAAPRDPAWRERVFWSAAALVVLWPMLVAAEFKPTLALIGGAIRAEAEELASNPRARSAVLRVAERLP